MSAALSVFKLSAQSV